MEKVETKISRDLMKRVEIRAKSEGRDSEEVVEDALRSYLLRRDGGIVGLLDRMSEGRRERGVEELSEEEAMKLAVEEQHAWRHERREQEKEDAGKSGN